MKHLTITTLLLTLIFFYSCNLAIKLNPKSTQFEYVNYEYGPPLQKNEGEFGIRRTYQLKNNKKLFVIDKTKQGYKITTLDIPEDILTKIRSFENLKNEKIKEKLDEGVHFAGAYDYININGQELTFINPLISEKLYELKKSLFAIDLSKGKQYVTEETPSEIDYFEKIIVPIHLKSNLPLIELPPPMIGY